ncbi:MAG: hypothetical protein ACKORF_07395, partial [Micrococcales bacterium]
PAPSLPAPAPSAPAAVAAPEPTQEPKETVVEPEPAKPAKKGRAGLVHEGASYGEPLLREILGAEPVTDPKLGK